MVRRIESGAPQAVAMQAHVMMTPASAVAFDLLTGLLDSWTLWDRAAGSIERGRAWRMAYLRLTYGTGAYVPYEMLVARAAASEGLPPQAAGRLIDEWDTLTPWPDVVAVLERLSQRVPLAIVTNCSEPLAARAIARLGNVSFASVVTAERAGWYKPDPRPYRLMLREVGCMPAQTLFVAGSPFDIDGAGSVGMPVYWHNRAGLPANANADAEREHAAGAGMVQHATLAALGDYVRA